MFLLGPGLGQKCATFFTRRVRGSSHRVEECEGFSYTKFGEEDLTVKSHSISTATSFFEQHTESILLYIFHQLHQNRDYFPQNVQQEPRHS